MTKVIQLIQIICGCWMFFAIETNSTFLDLIYKGLILLYQLPAYTLNVSVLNILLSSVLSVVFLALVKSSSPSVQFIIRYILLSSRMSYINLAVVTLGQHPRMPSHKPRCYKVDNASDFLIQRRSMENMKCQRLLPGANDILTTSTFSIWVSEHYNIKGRL